MRKRDGEKGGGGIERSKEGKDYLEKKEGMQYCRLNNVVDIHSQTNC